MDDLISRQAAIDAVLADVDDASRPITEVRWWNMGLTRASEILKQLPSAQRRDYSCHGCSYYDPKKFYCYKHLRGVEKAVYLCADAERRTDG